MMSADPENTREQINYIAHPAAGLFLAWHTRNGELADS